MQQADTIFPVPEASSVLDRVTHFFSRTQTSAHNPEQISNNIDWPDSNRDSKQPVCGGYNEAYIVQYWTSYHLR